VAEEHQNRGGMMHGGMTSTLVDVVSTSALMTNDDTGPGVSVDMSISLVIDLIFIWARS
jgi:acyl-coenzyme A thioesterase 13